MLNNIIIYKFMLIWDYIMDGAWNMFKILSNILKTNLFLLNIKSLFFIKIYVATLNLSKVE